MNAYWELATWKRPLKERWLVRNRLGQGLIENRSLFQANEGRR